MKYFDCFSGIGGFSLGIERATNNEWECVGNSEIDKYASTIYKYHFPKVRNYGDVSRIRSNELPNFDLFTFGFPCQDLSIAGKREGLEGSRSGLFFEAIRIINEKRPSYFIFENVKGLFSSNEGKDFELILRTITDVGYDGQWQLLNTSWFLPQNRERIYFVGHVRGKRRPEIFPIGEGNEIFADENRERNGECAKTIRANLERNMIQVGIIGKDSEATRIYDTCGISKTLTDGGGMGAKTGLYEIPNRAQALQTDGYLRSGSSFNTDRPQSSRNIRRLTPIECERLQGFPDEYTKYGIIDDKVIEISDTQRYKCLGNAVSVPVVEAIIKKLQCNQ